MDQENHNQIILTNSIHYSDFNQQNIEDNIIKVFGAAMIVVQPLHILASFSDAVAQQVNTFSQEFRSPIDFEVPHKEIFDAKVAPKTFDSASRMSINIQKIPHMLFDSLKKSLQKESSTYKDLQFMSNRDEIVLSVEIDANIEQVVANINEIISCEKHILKNEALVHHFCGKINGVVEKGARISCVLFGEEELNEYNANLKEIPYRKHIGKQIVDYLVKNPNKNCGIEKEIESKPENEELFGNIFDIADNADRRVMEMDPAATNGETTLECAICYDDLSYDGKAPHYLCCGDYYCKDCLAAHIKNCITNRKFPIACPKCNEYLALKEIQEILADNESFEQLKKVAIDLHFAQNAKFYRKCPGANCNNYVKCNTVEKQRVVHCEVCLKDYCLECRTEEHHGKTCEEMIEILYPGWTKYVRENNVKNCPACGFPCKKEEGCNQVNCPHCKRFFCYRCANFHGATAQEVYNHLNAEHGGYYDPPAPAPVPAQQ